jgi:hypothetical protein
MHDHDVSPPTTLFLCMSVPDQHVLRAENKTRQRPGVYVRRIRFAAAYWFHSLRNPVIRPHTPLRSRPNRRDQYKQIVIIPHLSGASHSCHAAPKLPLLISAFPPSRAARSGSPVFNHPKTYQPART